MPGDYYLSVRFRFQQIRCEGIRRNVHKTFGVPSKHNEIDFKSFLSMSITYRSDSCGKICHTSKYSATYACCIKLLAIRLFNEIYFPQIFFPLSMRIGTKLKDGMGMSHPQP